MDISSLLTISIATAAFVLTGMNESKIKKLEKRIEELEKDKVFF
ncbi:hypothetical protein ACQKII_17315 [Lysinibacillus sp. NPDC048646]